MNERSTQAVGHGVPPPLVLAAGLASLLLYKTFDLPAPLSKKARLLGIPLVLSGLLLGGTAVAAQQKAGTTPNPNQPTKQIVKTGPYRFTRNPIYLGMGLIFSGVAILMNAIWAVLLLPAMLFTFDRGMVRREEAYLEQKFGDDYRQYKQQVRRWI